MFGPSNAKNMKNFIFGKNLKVYPHTILSLKKVILFLFDLKRNQQSSYKTKH